MTSTRSYSEQSIGTRTGMALIWENLRRYWTIAFVAALSYFLVTVLPILLNYRDFDLVAGYVGETMIGVNPLVLTIDMVLAVVLSASLLAYLHRGDANIAFHSLPAKREHLFGSVLGSGVVLILLPLLMTSILLLASRGATTVVDASALADGVGTGKKAADIITLAACGKWLVKNLVVSCYTFVVACLAGVLAGTKVIHVLTALFFNALTGIVLLLSSAYMNAFLEGYPDNESILFDLARWTNPILYCGTSGTLRGSSVLGYVCFLLAGIVIAALALWIYKRVRLEREGDATVFPLMSDFLCIVVSFVCMSGFAFLAGVFSDSDEFQRDFLLYALCGGIVAFLVFRMVADNTPRIFHLKNLGKFGVFVVLTAVVFAFTVFDVQGYGKYVPASEEITQVSLTQGELFGKPAVFTEPSQIETIRKLHQSAIEKRTKDEDVVMGTMTIIYRLQSGKKIARAYQIDAGKLAMLAPLQRTKPFLTAQQFHITGSGKDLKVNGKRAEMTLDEVNGDPDEYISVRQTDIPAVFQAMNQDMNGMDLIYLLRLESEEERCMLNVSLFRNRKELNTSERIFCIDKHWPKTVKVLEARGYLK